MQIAQLPNTLRKYFLIPIATVCVLIAGVVSAEPFADPGDWQLRQEVEYLLDRGLINIPVTTWPLSWADILRGIESLPSSELISTEDQAVIERLRKRIGLVTRWGQVESYGSIALSEKTINVRTFNWAPRGTSEVTGTMQYTGRSLASRLQVTAVTDAPDDDSLRLDGSYLSYILGNYALTAGWQERWWGPGINSSLVLSTNARPVPGMSLQRNVSTPFEYRYLRWMGPWTLRMFFGRLEHDRAIPEANLLGARFAFRPLNSLEIGLTRTAQWGGEGRPDSLDSFFDLILGRDNQGSGGIGQANEPGNQLAGVDWRYRFGARNLPIVFHGQLIGEDEAGGFPSRYMGQFGLSTNRAIGWRDAIVMAGVEYSDTTCKFYSSDSFSNCAYNHGIYTDGYRYRGRSIGHSTDNDSRQIALNASVVEGGGNRWTAHLRVADLNRSGQPDSANVLAPTPRDYFDLELSHSRAFGGGRITGAVGFEQIDDIVANQTKENFRVFLKWSTSQY